MNLVMWNQYKKTAPFMQLGIAVTCVGAYFATGGNWLGVLFFFVFMQVAAVLGAAWGASIKYRRERANQKRDQRLPLEQRR